MSTLTDKLPKLSEIKLPEVKLPDVIDLDEAKKPAYAAVGVVDLSVEQVRTQAKELPATAKKLQSDLVAKFDAARTERTAQLQALPTQLKSLPTQATAQVKELRTDLTARVEKAQSTATAYYGKLAVRGEKLVGQIRRQPTTEAAIAEGKDAVKKAESAATSAKKSAKSTEKAVVDAAEKLG